MMRRRVLIWGVSVWFVASLGILACAAVVEAQSLKQRLQKRFDTDGDGQISAAERQAALNVLKNRRQGGAMLDRAQRMEWQVDGLQREALVFVPQNIDASSKPAPVVFGFHGHGGSAMNAVRSFHFHTLWPEAIVVYMQGIPTPGRLTDPDGKRNGWQHGAGARARSGSEILRCRLVNLERQISS